MKTSSARGSVLIATLTFIFLGMTLSGLALRLSSNTYRLSMRNQLRAEARAVAESELEYMFFKFRTVVVTGAPGADAPDYMTDICDKGSTPSTVRPAFLKKHRDAFGGDGWIVRRSFERVFGPELGQIPDSTKIGKYTYLIARVEVEPPASSPFAGGTVVRVGRRVMNSSTNVFQYSIFFQGDLELNPGSDVTINGDIVVNGSIYMGPRSGAQLLITDRIRYLKDHYFNQTAGGATTYSNPDAPAPPVTLVAPTFDPTKVEQMEEPENLLGFIEPAITAKARPDLFGPPGKTDPDEWSASELAEAENNVHRSLIAPPPSDAGSAEYGNATGSTADDPAISVRRAYNKAGLIMTVETDGSISFTKVVDGTTTTTNVFNDAIAGTTEVYDYREGKNVKMVDLDVGALKSALEGAGAFDFNGLLYVNLKGSSSSTPAAVRLVNATSLPDNHGQGFSVATNGGIYVKGSYNTTPIGSGDDARNVPAMLMADAITVLSSNWDDANASATLDQRVASLSDEEIADGNTARLNAGLLTGNRESGSGYSSGGAQNLVRYLEDWTGKSVAVTGSLGRLFQSTHYTAPFGGTGTVYLQPNRVFDFDEDLPEHNPPGSPETTAFSRGSFFTY